MTKFIISEIKKGSNEDIIFSIKTDDRTADYKVNFEDGRTLLSDELELLMRDKDFNYHREFGKIISTYIKNESISLPIDLFNSEPTNKISQSY